MTNQDCKALYAVLQTFLAMPPHRPDDLADLFDLLGRLSQAEKQTFWAWLGDNAPNIKRWMMAKGGGSRRAA
jgi:hypothetical protein